MRALQLGLISAALVAVALAFYALMEKPDESSVTASRGGQNSSTGNIASGVQLESAGERALRLTRSAVESPVADNSETGRTIEPSSRADEGWKRDYDLIREEFVSNAEDRRRWTLAHLNAVPDDGIVTAEFLESIGALSGAETDEAVIEGKLDAAQPVLDQYFSDFLTYCEAASVEIERARMNVFRNEDFAIAKGGVRAEAEPGKTSVLMKSGGVGRWSISYNIYREDHPSLESVLGEVDRLRRSIIVDVRRAVRERQ